MNYSALRRCAAMVIVMIAGAVNSHAQDVTLTDAATFSGTGTFNIKGNIVLDTSVTSTIRVTGSTKLVGDTVQHLGTVIPSGAGLEFERLHAAGTEDKLMVVPVHVDSMLALDNSRLVVNGRTLTVSGAATKTAGSLKADSSSDEVIYDSQTAQSVIGGGVYNKLTLYNNGGKDLESAVSAVTLSHTGTGKLTVNQNLTVTGSAAINAIADATATLSIQGASANSIQAVDGTQASGTIVNGSSGTLAINAINGNNGRIATTSGELQVGSLASNTGTIATAGPGNVRFTGHAVNSGVIADTNAAGSIVFDTTLVNNGGGNIVVGNGGASFAKRPSNSGAITAEAGTLTFTEGADNLGAITLKSQSHGNFVQSLNNSGTLTAQDTATAAFDKNFTSVGTLAFTGNSTANFQGTTDTIPGATFANLQLNGSNDKKTADSVKLTGNLALNKNLAVNGGKAVEILSAGSRVTGAGEVTGSVKRNHTFTPGQFYAFNKDTVGLAIDSLVNPEITLTMLPDSAFLTPAPSAKYINRRYAFNAAGPVGGAKITGLALTFTDAERSIVSLDESKLGVRYDAAGSWKKANNPLGYSRTVDTTNNIVTLASLATPIAGITELGLMNTAFVTIADNGAWQSGGTWDEGSAPSIGDDAEVNNTGITVGAPSFAASVTVNSGKSLTLQSTTLSVAGLFDLNGSLTVDAGTTLSLTNNLRIHGPVTNNGTINVGN